VTIVESATEIRPWAADGFWAADGVYSRVIPTIAMLTWIAGVSGFLMRRYSAAGTPDRVPVPAA
jgi:hypothetical protein